MFVWHVTILRHNDLPWNVRKFVHNQLGEVNLSSDLGRVDPWARSDWSHTDIPRLRAGLVGAQVNPTLYAHYPHSSLRSRLHFPEIRRGRFRVKYSEEIVPVHRAIFDDRCSMQLACPNTRAFHRELESEYRKITRRTATFNAKSTLIVDRADIERISDDGSSVERAKVATDAKLSFARATRVNSQLHKGDLTASSYESEELRGKRSNLDKDAIYVCAETGGSILRIIQRR